MSKNVDFEIGTIVTDVFLDSVQELLTGTVNNLRLGPSSLGTDRVALFLAGDTNNDNRGTANVGGRYVYTDGTQDSAPAGIGDGPKTIYLSTTKNGSPAQPAFDITVDSSPPPLPPAPAVAYNRELGTVTRTGAQLHTAKMHNGTQADADQYNDFTFRSIIDHEGATDAENSTLLALRGQDSQISVDGVNDSDASTSPTRALSVGYDVVGVFGETLYIDTKGRVTWKDRGVGGEDVVLQWADNDTTGGQNGVLASNREISSHVDGNAGSFSARNIATDINNRITILSEGTIEWGDGTAIVPDISLGRTAANQLSFDVTDQLFMPFAIPNTVSPVDGIGSMVTNKLYVDTQLGVVSSSAKRFSYFIGS